MADRKYLYYGALFLLIQVIIVAKNFGHDYYSFFWLCAYTPILFAIGFFIKNINFIKGLTNIALIPQIIFLIDLLCHYLVGRSIFSTTEVFFTFGPLFIITTFLLHLSSTFALLFTYKEKPSKKSLYYAFFSLLIIEFITLSYTFPIDNINFVYLPGELFRYFTNYNPYYSLLWIVFAFIIIVIPTYLIQHLIYKIHEKSRKRSLHHAAPHKKN